MTQPSWMSNTNYRCYKIDCDIKTGAGNIYVPETVDEYLLEEYIDVIKGPKSFRSICDKYSEEFKLLSLSSQHMLIVQRKIIDYHMIISSSLYHTMSQSK